MATSIIASEAETGADIDFRVFRDARGIAIYFGMRDDPEPAVIRLDDGDAYDIGMALVALSEG